MKNWFRIISEALTSESARQEAIAKYAPSEEEKEMAERDARIAKQIAEGSSKRDLS